MNLLTRTFWPNADTLPVRRVVQATILAPLIVSIAIVFMAFLIVGMTEQTSGDVLAVTLNAAAALIPLLFGFMLTFGAAGIAALMLLRQRGILSWAICGALMGALASLAMGEVLMGQVARPLLIASALAGWTMLLLFRWFAGIKGSTEDASDEEQS